MPTDDLSTPLHPTAPYPLCAARCALLAEVNHRTANQFTLPTSYIHLSLEEFRRNPGEIRDLQLAFASVEARARSPA
jgi:two-component sensor histidine kinase